MRSLKTCLIVIVSMCCSAFCAQAQSLNIVAIVSETGVASNQGRLQANTLRMLELNARSQGGIAGIALDIRIVDDQSDPQQALALASNLSADSHVLLCCTLTESAELVAALGLALPSLFFVELVSDSSYWVFQFLAQADNGDQLFFEVLEQHFDALGVMALDTLRTDLEESLRQVGLEPLELLSYAPEASVLTPEALWVATREPDAVLLWGEPRDSQLAFDALRQRGFEGPIVIRPEHSDSIGLDENTYTVLAEQYSASEAGASLALTAFEAQHRETFGTSYLRSFDLTPAKALWDALLLLQRGVEQSLGYGLDVRQVEVFRQAIRDALIALPEVTGVAGVYDFTEASQQLAARHYVLVRYSGTWSEALP